MHVRDLLLFEQVHLFSEAALLVFEDLEFELIDLFLFILVDVVELRLFKVKLTWLEISKAVGHNREATLRAPFL